MRSLMKFLGASLAAFLLVFGMSACEEEKKGTGGQQAEAKTVSNNFDNLQKKQPALGMDYSPTRDTKNFWIKTWGEKGKVSYVYLLSNGKPYAFAVLKRLPTTYCVGLVPGTKTEEYDFGTDAGGVINVPAPSIDGTYSSNSNCGAYYGEDATTGGYVEWTAGADTTMLLRDQPLPLNMFSDALPLGDTSANEAVKADDEVPATGGTTEAPDEGN